MANKAAKDITGETALNAVEEALSVDFADAFDDLSSIEDEIDNAAAKLKKSASSEDDIKDIDIELQDLDALPPSSPPAAANDEVNPELASVLYAIQQKPKSRIFLGTFIVTLLWLGACAFYAYKNILPLFGQNPDLSWILNSPALFSTPVLSFAAITILPLFPLWAFAVLVRRSQDMRHAANSMTEAAIQLLQPENTANSSVATVGQAIRREVNAIGDGVERAIARAGELEFMVQKEVMNLERSYGDSEVRLRRLVEEIGNERSTMITHADNLKQTISDSHVNLSTDIQQASSKIENTLREATSSMSETLQLRSDTITTKLTDTSEGLVSLLANTGETLNATLANAKKELEENISSTTQAMSSTITTNGKAVARLLETRTAGLQQATALIDEKLEANKKEFDESFSAKTTELSRVMEATGQSVNNLLKSTTSEIAEQSNSTLQKIEEGRTEFRKEMSEKTVDFANMIKSGSNAVKEIIGASAADMSEKNLETIKEFEASRAALNQDLAQQSATFAKGLSQVGEFVINKLETGVEELEKRGDKIAQQISDNLSVTTGEFVSQMSASGDNIAGVLGMRTEALDNVLKERTQAIGQTIADNLSGFGKNLTEQVDSTVGKLESQSTRLLENTKSVEDVITNKAKEVEDAVKSSTIKFAHVAQENLKHTAEKTAEINSALQKTSSEITASIDKSSENFTQGLENKKSEFTSAIQEKTDNFTKVVDGTTETFSKAIEERANNLSSKLSQGAHHIASSLEANSKSASERMEASVKALDARLSENSSTIEKQFAAGNQILEENLAKGKEELLGAVSNTLSQISNEIDSKADKMANILTDRAKVIDEKLGGTLVETQRNLEAKTDELNALLSDKSMQLSGYIDNEAKPVITAIVETGTETSQKLANLSKMIGEEANTLFSNIGNSSGLLERLIEDATLNLNSMQTSLSSQIEKFASAVETTKTNVDQSEAIALSLNENMQNSSRDMLSGMGTIAQRFEAQSVILQDATRMIDAAQTNLEATLEGKQEALQQLAVGIVSHSDQINNNMSSFQSLVSSMVAEASLKSQSVGSEVSAEISKAIEDATSRFDDAVNAMRSAANTMRAELEDTRAQMRKGILELPDETEKSAAEMRRVVTDQINALRDLSAIVEQSGKNMDTSKPVLAQPQRVAQRAPVTAPPIVAKPAPAPASAPAPSFTAPKASPAVDMALRGTRSEIPSPQAQPATPGRSTGWVSDLLRRASEEERAPAPTVSTADNRSPNQVVDSLNSLSVDIANAIDHETSVDLWDRYQRGETNVFTRRLYTLQGQQTFDEIRSKYARDTDFKMAVDRYMADFEQLLSRETNNGQNQPLTQSYLTSETGKVYTMLAHASGRLGN
jgi:hypothetical protein